MILLNCFSKMFKIVQFYCYSFRTVKWSHNKGVVDNCCTSVCRKMCEVASFKNFKNILTTVKFMTKTKVAPFYLGHGVVSFSTCQSIL